LFIIAVLLASTDSLDLLIDSQRLLKTSTFLDISKISQYSDETFERFDSKSRLYCLFVKLSNAFQLELALKTG
jgi:hypothetical protein